MLAALVQQTCALEQCFTMPGDDLMDAKPSLLALTPVVRSTPVPMQPITWYAPRIQVQSVYDCATTNSLPDGDFAAAFLPVCLLAQWVWVVDMAVDVCHSAS